MESKLIERLGDELYESLVTRKTIVPFSTRYPEMTIEDAYHVQQRMISRRLEHGERIVGKKIGVTSKAVMNMLGVHQPDFGYLLDGMVYNEGESIEIDTLIQPKAEGEIAFLLKKDLKGPGVTAADVLAATEGVMACFEIVDSRIQDWKIKIQDTVADNASCGVFVLGDKLVDIGDIDLGLVGMVLEKNGEIVVTGAGAATMSHPVNAMVWLTNTLGALGIALKAGDIVLSGAMGAMVPVSRGDNLRITIGGIGGCSVRFI
jgi:2-oxopent-4-enoate/cis-2-oxohex-4-enoate hydratase